jgi:hypothetical protein
VCWRDVSWPPEVIREKAALSDAPFVV